MKTQLFRFTLYAIIAYLTGFTFNPTFAASQPSVGHGEHFCGVIDYPPDKQHLDRYPNRRYTQTFAANLNVSEPLMVRLIYFLPNDRQPQPDIDAKLDALIKDVQQFYAEMMEKHGFGRQTFTLETDATGKAVVHHVNGKFNDAYYQNSGWVVWEEIEKQFDMSNTIYLAALDISSEVLDGGIACGRGGAWGPGAGRALIPASGGCFGAAAHELGHTFGLQHDLRANPKLISSSYTSDWMITSFCAAEWLEAHRAFNPGISPLNRNTTIEMLSLSLASPLNTVRLRFKVTDPDGLHQAQLLTPDIVYLDGEFFGLIACKQLTGTSSVVEFVTTELTPKSDSVSLQVIDVHGNFSWNEKFPIDITSLLPPPEAVSIPDAHLAAAVRGTPTTHTMLNLTRLEVPNRQITDLTGLEHAINLRRLHLGGNSITDVSALAGLTKLTYLNLDNTSISDVSALAGLPQLRTLYLGGNFITDVSALAGLPQLRTLYLGNNAISDVSALAELTQLNTLHLWGNSLSDISALAGLTQLTTLNLNSTSISDVSALAGLTQLRALHLGGNAISDVSALAGLTQLIFLGLRYNSITDVSALAGLTQLNTLHLWGNSLSDISALAGLTQLTTLNLNSTSISDVSALAGLTQLRALHLGGNAISDVSALAGLTQLIFLGLRYNSITDVSALAGLTQLNTLHLWGNSLSDISALAGLTQLTTLNLNNTSISDVSALAGLTQLRALHLGGNAISDVSALAGLTQLTTLNLGNNAISDVSPLLGLNLTGTQWNSTGLHLERNPLSYVSINTHIPVMQAKGIEVKFDNRTHRALLKISGDNQKGVSFAPLSNPFVVEAQDKNGSVLGGISVTFAVTAGGGTLSVTSTTTDPNGRAESTLTLGPNQGTHTVSVSAAGISSTVTFHAVYDTVPTEYFLSVPGGISLIHVPLKVTAVDGVAKPITSISDLYDALGGADTVNLLGTRDPKTQRWFSYADASDKGTSDDPPLTDDKGIIASMKTPVEVRLHGDALGTNGHSSITLFPGLNLVGVPLKDSRIARVSDLFALEGIGGNVSALTVLDNGRLKTVRQAGDEGDIPITGGQSFILRVQEATTVAISGSGWYNTSAMAASSPVAMMGIEVGDTTPILAVRGSIVSPVGGWGRMPYLRPGSGFRVIVKNLSIGRSVSTERRSAFPTVTGDEKEGYRLTMVDVETGRAAMIGDILEVSVQSPSPLIGVQPLRHMVTAEDVKRSRIQLTELVAYEIPTETELLANYPNPFNPETWIPYRLAEDAFVTLTIYDLSGQVVRTLDIGHQIAAVYESRSKAIYWDGRNGLGEQVASGVYFYTLTAGDYSNTRKIVVLK